MLRGYSETSLKDMRTFNEEWHPFIIRRPLVDELTKGTQISATTDITIDENLMLREIRQPMVGVLKTDI